MANVLVYTFGVCHCSVCVPSDMPREEVEDGANEEHQTGLDHGWKISDDAHFKGGEPNPCPCDKATGRMHYLMVC